MIIRILIIIIMIIIMTIIIYTYVWVYAYMCVSCSHYGHKKCEVLKQEMVLKHFQTQQPHAKSHKHACVQQNTWVVYIIIIENTNDTVIIIIQVPRRT